MASEVGSGGVFMGFFCLLLLLPLIHAVHGKTVPVDKFLLDSHRNSNISTSGQPEGETEEILYRAIYMTNYGEFYGAKAALTIYALPQVKRDQMSASEIWVASGLRGPKNQISVLHAGLHVRPITYGDTKTHFFTYWTADFYQSTGCFNLDCPGFVVNPHSEWRPGFVLKPISVINGTQWVVRFSITKDSQSGDWVLKIDNQKKVEVIGHWPKSLFKNSNDYADQFIWGGATSSLSNEPSPPMGSGRSAFEKGTNASFFSGMEYMNNDGSFHPVDDPTVYYDYPSCYDLQREHSYERFYYGGPGGCTCKESHCSP